MTLATSSDSESNDCGLCDQPTNKANELKCERCSSKYHLSCTSLPVFELLKYFKHNKRKFQCEKCIIETNKNEYDKLKSTVKIQNNNPMEKEKVQLMKSIRNLEEELQQQEERIRSLEKENRELRRCKVDLVNGMNTYEEELKRKERKIEELERHHKNEREGNAVKLEESSDSEDEDDEDITAQDELCTNETLKHIMKKIEELERKIDSKQKKEEKPFPIGYEKTTNEENVIKLWQEKPSVRCYFCGKPGHIIRNCYRRQNQHNFNNYGNYRRYQNQQYNYKSYHNRQYNNYRPSQPMYRPSQNDQSTYHNGNNKPNYQPNYQSQNIGYRPYHRF